MDIHAEPFPKRLQVARLRPARLIVGPRGQLKLEQPDGVLFDPFLDVFLELEFRQKDGGAVRPGARDRQRSPVDVGDDEIEGEEL